MTDLDLLKAIGQAADCYLLNCEPKQKHTIYSKSLSLLAACLLLCMAAVFSIALLRPSREPHIPPIASTDTDTTEPSPSESDTAETASSDTVTAASPPFYDRDELYKRQLEALDEANSDLLSAMGGGDPRFDLHYIEEVYNLAYLGVVYRGETPLLEPGILDDWVNNVYLKKSKEEQNALPTLAQAVIELAIPPDDFKAINDARRKRGSGMVLDDKVIDALYAEEAVMKEKLVHPLALYANGEVYSWNEVRALLNDSDFLHSIWHGDLWEYIFRIEGYCQENGDRFDRLFGEVTIG